MIHIPCGPFPPAPHTHPRKSNDSGAVRSLLPVADHRPADDRADLSTAPHGWSGAERKATVRCSADAFFQTGSAPVNNDMETD